MQIFPQETFTIVRGLENHLDSTTYYVQAVVRNAKTDALIATVPLTDQGNRRFSANWIAPADGSGQGTWIVITTTVYTDSGYTTKAENYGEKFEEHVILARPLPGGGGADVDYRRVRQIVREELKELEFPAPPEMPNLPFHLQPVLNALAGLRNDVSAISIPEPQAVDLRPVMAKIDALEKAIKAVEISPPDLSGVEYRLDKLDERIDAAELAKLKTDMDALFARIRQFFGTDMDEMKEKLDGVLKRFESVNYVGIKVNPNDDEQGS